ncbi:MAG TPA: hypothetical protein VFO77_04595 [Actinoplanes sp.]|nr:hypothetical protein [Actinoplanes sp.]
MRKRLAAAVVTGAFISAAVGHAPPASAAPPATGTAAGANVQADFNSDGVADLAVGAPRNDSGARFGGAVHVIYGSRAGGLRAKGNQRWTQNSPGIAGKVERGDQFGYALAAGDFNGDAFSDLAIAAPYEDAGSVDGGAVHVLYGSATGLTATGSQVWTQDSAGLGGLMEQGDKFGLTLAAGNLGRSTHDDLVVGVPDETLWLDGARLPGTGAVNVIFGSTAGLDAAGNQMLTQHTPQTTGTPEIGDGFGRSLAIGNFGRSAYGDLAVGVGGEFSKTAGVHVIYGATRGLNRSGRQYWTQTSPGILNGGSCCRSFGRSLAAGDLGRSRYDDLAIGAPDDSPNAEHQGSVTVLYGARNGLSAAGNQYWTQDSAGIGSTGAYEEAFGQNLTIGNFGKSAHSDLAIGVPGESTAGDHDGLVQVIYGSAVGLSATGSQSWNQDSPGIAGHGEDGDAFGAVLAAADFGRSGHADLVVGVPSDRTQWVGAGGLNVIYGTADGLRSAGSQYWNQDSPGIVGASQPYGEFGRVLAQH